MAGLNVKFLKGTKEKYEEYKVQSLINPNSFYHIDGKDLYLGLIKLSNEEDIVAVETRVSLLEQEHSEFVKASELQELLNPLISKDIEIESEIALLKKDNQEIVKEINELKPLIQSMVVDINKHSKLLEGFDENTTIKSLIETSADAADEAKQIAQNVQIEVLALSNNVYTKTEVDDIIASKTISWQDME
jgi:hypothetical protein